MNSRLLLFLIFAVASRVLLAQSTAPPPEGEPTMQSLLDRIQQMEKRINELEAHERGQAAAPAASTVQTPNESKPGPPVEHLGPQPTDHMHNLDVRETEVHYPSLQIRGFGDVDFSGTDQRSANSGFSLGQSSPPNLSPVKASCLLRGSELPHNPADMISG